MMTKVDCVSKAFIPGKNPKPRGSKMSQMSNFQSEIQSRKSRLVGLALRLRMAFGSVQTNMNIPEYGISARNPFSSYHDLPKI